MSDDSLRDPDEIMGYTEEGAPVTRRFLRLLVRCGYDGTATYYVGMFCPEFTLDDV